MKSENNLLIITAGGIGSRMGADIPKQFLKLGNKEIIIHTIEAFLFTTSITKIIITTPYDYIEYLNELVNQYFSDDLQTNIEVIEGGKTRQESIYNALQLSKHIHFDLVLIHDGVRPFVSSGLIHNLIAEAETNKAAIPAINLKETCKEIVIKGNLICVSKTIPRDNLMAIQTPQVFAKELIVEAHNMAIADQFIGTDDSSLVERLGHQVIVIEGEEHNIKITTKFDLEIAKVILNQKM